MIKTVPRLATIEIPFTSGLDEISPANKILMTRALKMQNFRMSKDGMRVEKRKGLLEEVTTFAEDIFGYLTYFNTGGDFCQLAVTESKLKRKVGAGAWTDIYSLTGTLAHPVKPLEIQGRIFAITENDARFIHTNGSIYQAGITPPSSLATLTAEAGGSFVAGTYRYAVTYARSGNYGNESNPIKSLVGDEVFTGTGLDDADSGGSYTGDENISIVVKITTAAATDKVDISYDGGTTWHVKDLPITATLYLSYGVTVTFGAVTGHTLNDYWTIACSAFAVTVADNQRVAITNLPVSGDAQVNQRKIYRTTLDGALFYWLATINDNTTTSFKDNIPDAQLGELMAEDNEVVPEGKFSAWWDNRLWVSGDLCVYYSGVALPEAFDTANRYCDLISAVQGDEITGMVAYKDNLYVFTKNTIHIIQKLAEGDYGVFLCNKDMGCIAPGSLVEVNNLLMFLSYRGIEAYNGCDTYSAGFSLPMKRTLETVDTTKLEYVTSVHNRTFNEVWFSFPDSPTSCVIVFSYVTNCWYKFVFYEGGAAGKAFSMMTEVRNSSEAYVTKVGTRDGYLCLADGQYGSDGTGATIATILATIRKPWLDLSQYADVRRIDCEFELETGKTLTSNLYINFDKDVFRTASHTGVSPSSTDDDIRNIIYDYAELGLRGRWVSLEFVNNEALTADLRINGATLYASPRWVKHKVSPD